MATQIIMLFTLYSGEVIVIRRREDGSFICPVCGCSLPQGTTAPYDGPSGHGSQDICPCCDTQYGHDDAFQGNATLQGEWMRLRMGWLARGGWREQDKRQLVEALEIHRAYLDREQQRAV